MPLTQRDAIRNARSKRALIIVDVQNDFLPGGSLAVADGDKVIAPILAMADTADVVIASMDWHPANHCSFEAQGGEWPEHCVAQNRGADLHEDVAAYMFDRLHVQQRPAAILRKGYHYLRDSYSAFDAWDGVNLATSLRRWGVDRIVVAGLATDFCVAATAIGAVNEGFLDVSVAMEATRAVRPAMLDLTLDRFALAGVEMS